MFLTAWYFSRWFEIFISSLRFSHNSLGWLPLFNSSPPGQGTSQGVQGTSQGGQGTSQGLQGVQGGKPGCVGRGDSQELQGDSQGMHWLPNVCRGTVQGVQIFYWRLQVASFHEDEAIQRLLDLIQGLGDLFLGLGELIQGLGDLIQMLWDLIQGLGDLIQGMSRLLISVDVHANPTCHTL